MESYLLIGGGIVVLAAILLFFSFKNSAKRTEVLQSVAERMGGTFEKDVAETFMNRFNMFELFSRAKKYSYCKNLIQASIEESEVAVFDYHYTIILEKGWFGGEDTDEKSYSHTVCSIRSNKINLPQFALTKQSFLSVIGTALGLENDIDFENHQDFSDNFRLSGATPAAIRNLFNEPVILFFENNRDISVEAQGDEMIVYCDQLKPEEIQAFVDKSFEIFRHFQQTRQIA
jgi:hypothetical protein